MKISESEFAQVVSLLENIQGEAAAWTTFQISSHLHIDQRRLQHLFETRIRDFPFPVGSTEKGFFVITNAAEANASRHYKTTRFAKLQARVEAEEFLCRRKGIAFENGRFVDAPRQTDLFAAPIPGSGNNKTTGETPK